VLRRLSDREQQMEGMWKRLEWYRPGRGAEALERFCTPRPRKLEATFGLMALQQCVVKHPPDGGTMTAPPPFPTVEVSRTTEEEMSLPPPESTADRILLIESRLVAIEAALAGIIRTAPHDGRTQALFALAMMILASQTRPGPGGLSAHIQAAANNLGTMACGPDWHALLPPIPGKPQ
jgi:hypothetical protein